MTDGGIVFGQFATALGDGKGKEPPEDAEVTTPLQLLDSKQRQQIYDQYNDKFTIYNTRKTPGREGAQDQPMPGHEFGCNFRQ